MATLTLPRVTVYCYRNKKEEKKVSENEIKLPLICKHSRSEIAKPLFGVDDHVLLNCPRHLNYTQQSETLIGDDL